MKVLFSYSCFVLLVCYGQVSAQVKKMYVNDHFAQCRFKDQEKCLMVKDSLNGQWTYLRGHIEGFTYKEGYRYTLMVQTSKYLTGDTSLVRYVLKEVLHKQKKYIDPEFRLDDAPWFLTSMRDGKKMKETPRVRAFILLKPDDELITGNTGCNKITGVLKVADASFTVDKVVSTKMACSDPSGHVEQVFLQLLQKVNAYRIKRKHLMLFHNRTLIFDFKKK